MIGFKHSALYGVALLAATAAGFGARADESHRLQVAQAQTPAATPAAATREITQIAGNVYRFRNNFHFSVFLVTPAGIVATDPINADAARWLKGELQSRFNQPVKYLVLSHDHADHSSGGEVFADTAIVVSHERARSVIVGEKRPTAVPQVTFSDKMNIELGGQTVELSYVGRNHSDNSVVMRFPAEKIVFAVDFIPIQAMAFRDFPDAYIAEWIESVRRVEAMEFDTLAPGHGPLGKKDDVRAFRLYMEDLHGQVLKLAREGKSVEQVKEMVDLSKYKSWAGFEQMGMLNVEGMYRHVQLNRRGN